MLYWSPATHVIMPVAHVTSRIMRLGVEASTAIQRSPTAWKEILVIEQFILNSPRFSSPNINNRILCQAIDIIQFKIYFSCMQADRLHVQFYEQYSLIHSSRDKSWESSSSWQQESRSSISTGPSWAPVQYMNHNSIYYNSVNVILTHIQS